MAHMEVPPRVRAAILFEMPSMPEHNFEILHEEVAELLVVRHPFTTVILPRVRSSTDVGVQAIVVLRGSRFLNSKSERVLRHNRADRSRRQCW